MDATTPNKDVAATDAAKKPLKVFRLEDVTVCLFANRHQFNGELRTFYNVSMSRTFKKGQEIRRTQTFGVADLGRLVDCLNQASAFVQSLQQPQPEAVKEH